MRLVQLMEPQGDRRLAVLEDQQVVVLPPDGPCRSFRTLLEQAGGEPAQMRRLVRAACRAAGSLPRHDYETVDRAPARGSRHLLSPLEPSEVWAAGVTYERSRQARAAESTIDILYNRVYEADRPELFFKATAARVAGPRQDLGLRQDSRWLVPEPELALVLAAGGGVVGYTIGNDMTARDIEGENPLYLPQAKIFRGSCALGPAVLLADAEVDPYDLEIRLQVTRGGQVEVEAATSTSRLHKRLDELIRYLGQDNPIFSATVLMTGTGIVPPDAFSLQPGDIIAITVPQIGTLVNPVMEARGAHTTT